MRQSLPTFHISSFIGLKYWRTPRQHTIDTEVSISRGKTFTEDSISLWKIHLTFPPFEIVSRPQFYRHERAVLRTFARWIRIENRAKKCAIRGRPKLANFTTTRCIKLVQRPAVATPTCSRLYLRSVSFRGRRLARYWISILIVNRGMPSSMPFFRDWKSAVQRLWGTFTVRIMHERKHLDSSWIRLWAGDR